MVKLLYITVVVYTCPSSCPRHQEAVIVSTAGSVGETLAEDICREWSSDTAPWIAKYIDSFVFPDKLKR